MKQRINLFQVSQKSTSFDKNSLSGNAVIAVVVIGVVLVLGLGLKFFADTKQAELANLKTEKRNVEAQVQALQKKFSSQTVSVDLQAEIKRLKGQIDSRGDLMSLLDQIDPEQTYSFSAYLLALAESSEADSWLTDFSINTKDRSFLITGGAANGPAVSSMLESIAKTTPFADMAVTSLEVQSEGSNVRFQAEAELSVNE